MSSISNKKNPLDQVVSGGYCIGCGACAVVDPSIRIAFNHHRQYQAMLPIVESEGRAASSVCPFAEGNPNENDIGKELYSDSAAFDPMIGYHIALYAGWVKESDFRASGSSGGMGSWVLCELLTRGFVDYVVLVEAADPSAVGDPLFRYTIVSSVEEVRSNAKSRYYPVELSRIAKMIQETDGKYAVVGIPCFLKALRLLCRQDLVLRERVAYTVGLVCGHLKSAAFSELLAWQVGINPEDLREIDFRRKIPGEKASNYGVMAQGSLNGQREIKYGANRDLLGSNWGLGFFKYKACEYCDDVMAELADITIGDAWLPEYEKDDRGTNIIVLRKPELLQICKDAAATGRIQLEPLGIDRIVASQDAGFRHRREGLAYRLHIAQSEGRWHPPKRIEPDEKHIPRRRKQLLRLRYKMSEISHESFAEARAKGDLGIFMKRMKGMISAHGRLSQPPRGAMIGTVKSLLVRILRATMLYGILVKIYRR